jgi:hypothetical protein
MVPVVRLQELLGWLLAGLPELHAFHEALNLG